MADSNGNPLKPDLSGRYHLAAGEQFVAQVYVDDLRDVGDAGGVFAAFTDLLAHEQLLLESLSDAERVELADLLRDLMQQFTPSG